MRTTEATCVQIVDTARPNSHEKRSSSVTALLVERILGELGVHATLIDLVRGAQLFERATSNRVRATSRSIICAE